MEDALKVHSVTLRVTRGPRKQTIAPPGASVSYKKGNVHGYLHNGDLVTIKAEKAKDFQRAVFFFVHHCGEVVEGELPGPEFMKMFSPAPDSGGLLGRIVKKLKSKKKKAKKNTCPKCNQEFKSAKGLEKHAAKCVTEEDIEDLELGLEDQSDIEEELMSGEDEVYSSDEVFLA